MGSRNLSRGLPMSCGCADVCNCFLSDTDTVSVTGNGTSATPYQATVIPGCGLENTPLGVQVAIDPATPIPVTCSVDGLSVGPAPVCVEDSGTVDLTVDVDGCISADVIVDPALSNLLTESGAGVLADLRTTDTSTVAFTGEGTIASPLMATVVAGGGGGVAMWEAGMEMGWAGSVAPAGWLLEDGAFVPQATYPALFGVTGHAFNGGVDPADGTFKLPDCRGRSSVGPDFGAGRLSAANTVGAAAGTETHLLTGAESGTSAHGHGVTDPSHAHAVTGHTDWDTDNDNTHAGAGNFATGLSVGGAQSAPLEDGIAVATATGVTVDNSAAANAVDAHPNMHPYQVKWTIIKY